MTAPLRTDDLTDAAPMHGPGHRLPETQVRYAKRNRLLVEAAEIFFPGTSMLDAAIRLHHALDLYRGGRWRHEREAESCPAHRIGRINGHLWCILKLVDRVPKARTLREIFAYSSPTERASMGSIEPRGGGNDG